MSDNRTNLQSDGTDPLGRVSTSQAIVNKIASEILDGRLEPGEELKELDLAGRLGVSRPSLREAITQLAYRGLIERRPHRSVRVVVLSKEDADDIRDVRNLIEAEAFRRIAKDSSKWPMIEKAVERLDQLPDEAAWSEVAEADIAFHRAVVSAASSRRLSRAHDQLVDELRLVLVPGRHYSGSSEMAMEHGRLYEAITSGDPDLAVERLREHVSGGADLIRDYLPEGTEPGEP